MKGIKTAWNFAKAKPKKALSWGKWNNSAEMRNLFIPLNIFHCSTHNPYFKISLKGHLGSFAFKIQTQERLRTAV